MNPLLRIGLILWCALFLVQCDLEDPLEPLTADDLFTLEFDQNAVLFANGADQLALTVQLSFPAKENITVTFETEFGSFVGAPQTNTQMVTVDTKFEAIAFLRTDNIPRQQVKVVVTVEGVSKTETFDFLEIPNFVQLSTESTPPFLADGNEIVLVATVAEQVALFQDITFVTESGVFIEDGDGNQTITKQIQDRTTTVRLQTPTDPVDDVLVVAQVGDFSAQINLDFLPEDLSSLDFFDLSIVGDATILADNISEAQIFVALNERFDNSLPLTISIEQGSFSNSLGQVPTNDGKLLTLDNLSDDVTAFIRADVIPNPAVTIVASHSGFSELLTLTFAPAPPLSGTISRSKFEVTANGNDAANITASFLRSGTSLVSDNQTVIFEATPIDTSMAIAQFSAPTTITKSQEATTTIFSENNLPGDVEVKAYLLNNPDYTDTLKIGIRFVE